MEQTRLGMHIVLQCSLWTYARAIVIVRIQLWRLIMGCLVSCREKEIAVSWTLYVARIKPSRIKYSHNFSCISSSYMLNDSVITLLAWLLLSDPLNQLLKTLRFPWAHFEVLAVWLCPKITETIVLVFASMVTYHGVKAQASVIDDLVSFCCSVRVRLIWTVRWSSSIADRLDDAQ